MEYNAAIQRDIDDLIAMLSTFPDFDPADPFGDRKRAERMNARAALRPRELKDD